jgi:hypothetical protein
MSDLNSEAYVANSNKVVNITLKSQDWKDLAKSNKIDIAKNLELYLEQDFSFDIHQDYEDPLAEIMAAAKGSLLGSVVNGLQGVVDLASLATNVKNITTLSGAKAWKGSSQVSFDLQFNFYMGMTGAYSGKTEVYNPIRALGYIFLPHSNGFLTAPGPSYADLLSNQAKTVLRGIDPAIKDLESFGVDVAKALTEAARTAVRPGSVFDWAGIAQQQVLRENRDKAWKVLKASIDETNNQVALTEKNLTSGNVIAITIGKIYQFDSILPISFQYSFSKEMDSEGWPISGKCSIHCETMLIGTTDSIKEVN